jgi:hypothetical protein
MLGIFKSFVYFMQSYHWGWSNLPKWTPEDATRLKSYLESYSGNHLALRLRNASIQHNAKAVAKGDRWDCGLGYGYMLCITDLQRLSVAGEPKLPEMFDDSKPEGAEEYIARMAP